MISVCESLTTFVSSDCSSFKMAPSPEYDKEPKAPDKSATHISSEETKLLPSLVNDQPNSSDHETTNSATNPLEKKVSRSLLPFFDFEG